jgi:dTDP-glucose 4,6-dehydratase
MNEGEDKIEHVTDRPGHDRRYAIDGSKTHAELGWKPEHDFDSALEKTIEWYKKNEDWWKSLK